MSKKFYDNASDFCLFLSAFFSSSLSHRFCLQTDDDDDDYYYGDEENVRVIRILPTKREDEDGVVVVVYHS